MSGITLPMSPIISELESPKRLIIFSKPKVGKSTALAQLEKCLILDFEEGTDYLDALKMKIIGINASPQEKEEDREHRYKNNKYYLTEVGKAIRDAGFPYEYIAIDTTTAMEDMCIGYAEMLYSKVPMGKYWFVPRPNQDGTPGESDKSKYGNILNLPDGAGYKWLRDAVEKVINFVEPLAPNMILSAHIKDVQLEKNDTIFSSADIDHTGKIKRIIAFKADAIGYVYRRGKKTMISFKTSDEIACGARPKHLKNAEFTLAEEIDGEIKTYWNQIYIKK